MALKGLSQLLTHSNGEAAKTERKLIKFVTPVPKQERK